MFEVLASWFAVNPEGAVFRLALFMIEKIFIKRRNKALDLLIYAVVGDQVCGAWRHAPWPSLFFILKRTRTSAEISREYLCSLSNRKPGVSLCYSSILKC